MITKNSLFVKNSQLFYLPIIAQFSHKFFAFHNFGIAATLIF